MDITLRDGSRGVSGYSSIVEFDPASRDYPVYDEIVVAKRPLITKIYTCPVRLSQISGSCVAFCLAHGLLSDPVQADPNVVTQEYAQKRIYFPAQRNDVFPGGEYPGANPKMQGTSLLAGVKVLKRKKWIKGYRWAFTTRQLKAGIVYRGPAAISIPWYKGMDRPSFFGYLKPKGLRYSQHAILILGIDMEKKRYIVLNSWGPNWGDNGCAFIKFRHMKRLLSESGQALFLIGQKSVEV